MTLPQQYQPGYGQVVTAIPFSPGQRVGRGTWWESRTGEVKAEVTAVNSVLVWFRSCDRDGRRRKAVLDIERFLRVFHEVKP